MIDIAIEIIGWVAAALILASYGLLTAGKLTADNRIYHWMNVVGAAGILLNSGWNHAIPSAALNLVWAAIGLAALWRIGRKKDSSTSAT